MSGQSHREFWSRRPLVLGVVHLPPLPGAPGGRPDLGATRPWLDRARQDAHAYRVAGFDGVVLENYGDAPYFARRVPPETIASMSVAAEAVREELQGRGLVGVNVLRNDAVAAISIAAAAGLDFVRVNVLTGAVVADQGLVEGDAARVLRTRARLAPEVRILADVRVKHAAPLAPRPLEEEAADLLERAGADALIATGPRTGAGVARADLEVLRRAAPDALLLVGSGATTATVGSLLAIADGVIVGTAVKREGRTSAEVDARRAEEFVAAARG